MDTYYLVKIQNDETCGVFRYTSYDDALASMHSELAYRSADRNQTLCVIIKGDSTIPNLEFWKKQEVSEE